MCEQFWQECFILLRIWGAYCVCGLKFWATIFKLLKKKTLKNKLQICGDLYFKIGQLPKGHFYTLNEDRGESIFTTFSYKQLTLSIIFSIVDTECNLPEWTADLQNDFTFSGCILGFIVQEMNGAVE